MGEVGLSSLGSGAREPESEIGAGAPEPAQCRARFIHIEHRAAWCLCNEGPRCRFSLSFGASFLCEHPERERIIARTLGQDQGDRAAA
jgi:hypothetical protein